MPTPILKSKYQLVTYLSTREAARLSGVDEHLFLEAVRNHIVDGIGLPSGDFFVRRNDFVKIFLASTMGRDVDATQFAEPNVRSWNYEHSARSNDASHVGDRHGDAS